MIIYKVLHRTNGKGAGLQPMPEKQLFKNWPEIKCYASSEMNLVLPGFGVGEYVAHYELVKT